MILKNQLSLGGWFFIFILNFMIIRKYIAIYLVFMYINSKRREIDELFVS